jgi:hypothetical protein
VLPVFSLGDFGVKLLMHISEFLGGCHMHISSMQAVERLGDLFLGYARLAGHAEEVPPHGRLHAGRVEGDRVWPALLGLAQYGQQHVMDGLG